VKIGEGGGGGGGRRYIGGLITDVFFGLQVDGFITGVRRGGVAFKRQFALFHNSFVCRLSFLSVNHHHHLQVVQLSLETPLKNVHRVLLALFVIILPRMPWSSAMAALGCHW